MTLLITFSDYKEKIGFTGQLLIEPKPKEPTKHQYDYGKYGIVCEGNCLMIINWEEGEIAKYQKENTRQESARLDSHTCNCLTWSCSAFPSHGSVTQQAEIVLSLQSTLKGML